MPARHIRGFDGLRAIAISAVLVWHAHTTLGFPTDRLGPLGPLIASSWAGVDLFFALSGFLITTLLLDEESARGRFSLGGFYLRRALRILPAFYAVFLVEALLLSHLSRLPSADLRTAPPSALLAFGAFFGNYFLHYVQPGLSVGAGYVLFWSLCVEEHFYLAWPLVLSTVRSGRARLGLAAAVCALVPLLRWWVRARAIEPAAAVHFVSHYRIDAILAGALAALAFGKLARHARARRLLLFVAGGGVIASVLAHTLSVLPPATVMGQSLGYVLLAAACALVVAEVAASQEGVLVRALEWRPLVAIGRRSYGMYLVHLIALDVARRLLAVAWPGEAPLARPLALVLSGSLFTFALAELLYRSVERPFLRLKARLTAGRGAWRPATSPAPAPPAPASGTPGR